MGGQRDDVFRGMGFADGLGNNDDRVAVGGALRASLIGLGFLRHGLEGFNKLDSVPWNRGFY